MKTRKSGGGWFTDFFSGTKKNADTAGTKYVDAANTRVFDSLSDVKSPFKEGKISSDVYTAADYANFTGTGSRLTEDNVAEINEEIKNEIENAPDSFFEYLAIICGFVELLMTSSCL